jgi:hypothetical protein
MATEPAYLPRALPRALGGLARDEDERQQAGALPAAVDLLLYEGDSFSMTLVLSRPDGEPFEMTGASAQSQIRETFDAPSARDFQTGIEGNVIALHLASAESTGLPERAVWDVQVGWDDGTVTTVAFGNVTVQPEVTR